MELSWPSVVVGLIYYLGLVAYVGNQKEEFFSYLFFYDFTNK
jgi:hypothetical protein